MMTIRDFIKQEIDIDVCDDVCEELYIAFCGSLTLTEEGEKEFADVLEYGVDMGEDVAIINVDDGTDDGWEKRLKRAKKFFYSAAGYCPCDDYERWFITEDY